MSVERNRKEARIVIDGALKNEVREPPGPVRALHLTSDLVVGATTDYRDGYVGCIRALLLNGQLQDLRSYARQSLYGISEGCMGKCESNPCLNNGTCHERYDGYSCDCRWTAFKGPICADGMFLSLIKININIRLPEKCFSFTNKSFTTTHLYINMKPNLSNVVIFIFVEQNRSYVIR